MPEERPLTALAGAVAGAVAGAATGVARALRVVLKLFEVLEVHCLSR